MNTGTQRAALNIDRVGLAAALLLLSLLLLVLLFEQRIHSKGAPRDQLQLLTHAQLSTTVPDPHESDTTLSVTLPHHWGSDAPGFYGDRWYQLAFSVRSKGDQPWCALLTRVNMNAAVFLNDTAIGTGGSMGEPLARNWHRPLLFCFASSLLAPGINHFDVRVKAFADRFGSLGSVWVGPQNEVMPEYRYLELTYQTVYEITTSLSFILAGIIGFLWWRRRTEPWLWFALTGLCWGISGLNQLTQSIPFDTRYWEWAMSSAVGLVPIFLTIFLHRLQGRRPLRRERWLLGITLTFTIALLLSPLDLFFRVGDLWHAFALLVGGYIVWQVYTHYRRTGSREFLVILLCFAMMLLFAVHDMLVQIQVLDPTQIFLLNFSVPAFLLVITILLINRFVSAVEAAENLNRTLESRVQKAESEIERTYRQLVELETEQAINHERSRIMRDLHDDLGGKLLTMVYEAPSEVLQNLARSTLEDMRELVRAGQAAPIALQDFLADMRVRLLDQVEPAGFEFQWQVSCADDAEITGEQAMHLKRILTEGVVNALRHSNGNRVAVSIRCERGEMELQIHDNGIGTAPLDREGNGVRSMQNRSKRLGGEILWQENAQGGCGVHLRWHYRLTG